jgi:hypothetical protein
MKKALLALVLVGLAVANLGAAAYTYVDIETSQSGTFDLTNKIAISTNPFDISRGYNSLTQVVNDAYAEFVFLGVGNAQVNLAGSIIGKSIVLGGTLGSDIFGSVLLDLGADGKLSYSVQTALKGFSIQTPLKLVSASLTAHASTRVPDGGPTLTLLGIGLLSILGAQRMLASGDRRNN